MPQQSRNHMIARLLLIGVFTHCICQAQTVPYDRFYPVEAPLVPVDQAANLQALLNQHGVIRLQPRANYRVNLPGTHPSAALPRPITLRSGQRIYGFQTIVPEIVVEPGCTGAVVSGVIADLRFPASTIPTRNNLFRRVTYGTGRVEGATLVDNLFLDNAYWAWRIDTSQSGFLQNNRFIRQVYQATGDACVWTANPSALSPTTGNVMLWANFLTPPQRKYHLTNLDELTIINYDCEAPGSNGSAAIQATNCGRIAVFGTTGTNSSGPVFSGGARQVWLHGSLMYNQMSNQASEVPNNVVAADNMAFVQTMFDLKRPLLDAEGGTSLRAFELRESVLVDIPPKFELDGDDPPTSSTAAQRNAVLAATARLPVPVAWEAPVYRQPPSVPSGAIRPEGRAELQAKLDTDKIVILEPGVYVLDGPLKLGAGKVLIGSGMDKTFLDGASQAVDLIVDDGTSTLLLSDLTLSRARNGIFHKSPFGPNGTQVQFTDSVLSHVCIRDMTEAGLFFTDIFGYDNNFFEQVIFYNCKSGLKQLATTGGTEVVATINYMDKNVFYQCQWLNCGKALDLVAIRASGGNCWINCRFQDNTECVSKAKNHSPMTFVNCDLINNAGHPVVGTDGFLYLIACRFNAGARNPVDLADSFSVTLEGCKLFRPAGSSTVLTSGTPEIDLRHPYAFAAYTNRRFHLFNNYMPTISLGGLNAALLVNNSLGTVNPAPWSSRFAAFYYSSLGILDSGAAVPGTRLLNGSTFPAWLSSGAPPN